MVRSAARYGGNIYAVGFVRRKTRRLKGSGRHVEERRRHYYYHDHVNKQGPHKRNEAKKRRERRKEDLRIEKLRSMLHEQMAALNREHF